MLEDEKLVHNNIKNKKTFGKSFYSTIKEYYFKPYKLKKKY